MRRDEEQRGAMRRSAAWGVRRKNKREKAGRTRGRGREEGENRRVRRAGTFETVQVCVGRIASLLTDHESFPPRC